MCLQIRIHVVMRLHLPSLAPHSLLSYQKSSEGKVGNPNPLKSVTPWACCLGSFKGWCTVNIPGNYIPATTTVRTHLVNTMLGFRPFDSSPPLGSSVPPSSGFEVPAQVSLEEGASLYSSSSKEHLHCYSWWQFYHRHIFEASPPP